MVKFKMTALVALIAMLLLAVSLNAQEKRTSYKIKSFVDENGEIVNVYRYAGFPPKELPLANTELPKVMAKDGEKGFFALTNVPAYTWAYGCTATATAILAAYYDNYGAPTIYTGPANGGVAPQTSTVWPTSIQPDTDGNPLAASKIGVDGRTEKGHGDDYWTGYLDEATDPYYGAWTEHDYNVGQRCAADFMGTNQWYNWENADGSTSIWSSAAGVYDYTGSEGATPALRDGIHGVRLFYEALGLTVDRNYTRTITGYDDPDDDPDMGPATGGYEFAMYKKSVDQGRPVYIQVEGHSMIGFGYDDTTTPQTLYLRDTWDTNTSQTAHSMPWGGVYSAMQHYAISEIILGTECYYAVPSNVFALNNNRTVTITWDDPSKGTKAMSYIVFRDGAQIATGVTTTSYQDTGASDGTHYWSVKAVYLDPDPDYTSFMSDPAYAYVSVSVLNFSDDFERTVITDKWLFNPTTGYWGRDTVLKYAGLASLADSPGVNYTDNTDGLPLGGSVAEIAPGLNFTTAADANINFWITYNIEESFDYLHFQSCKDGLTWVTLKTWSSEVLGDAWAQENINLGLFAGESNVRFRFILVTDPGYNASGSNIDNINIVPSTVDAAAPYVYYTKEKDYHSDYPDGFQISTTITDFTGINYARVYYKVNGGTESYVTMSNVGSTYSCTLPIQTPGSLVEFRFQCQDTVTPTANSGSTGPFYYRDGLHQKFDSGVVSYYTEVVTTTAQYDQKSVANLFTSFHDDIAGAIIRGYDDASQPEDNANMLVNVWAVNAGLPGATMITPVSFTNPATLAETNAFGYVDLSSYTALDDIAGDYFIGFECGTVPNTTVTRSTTTAPSEEGTFDYKRSYTQYYSLAGSGLMWEQSLGTNYHIRCVTTNYGVVPGIIDLSPGAIAETVPSSSTSTRTLNVGNIGGYSLDYNATIDYNGVAGQATVASNDFATVLGWTSSGTPGWTRVTTWDGGSLNGTGFAKVSAATTGSGTGTGYLTSGIINLSAYGDGRIQWIQKTVLTTGTASVQVSNDGTTWFTIYSTSTSLGAWSNGNAQSVTIPAAYLTATARFRFVGTLVARSGNYFAIDNIVVQGDVPYTWMTLDGGTTTSGTVAVSASDPITVGFNTAGLTFGNTYTAYIRATSDNSNESAFISLTVGNPPPAVPTLALPADASSTSDLTPTFDWNDVSGATSYTILVDNNSDYSSPEINQSPTVSTYTPASNLAAGTYYWKVLATNANGSSDYSTSWTVTLTSGTIIPAVPTPITSSVVSGNVKFDWPDMADATSYDVYSSTTPYGTFTLLTNVTVSEYTYTPTATKMFFQIVSKNSTKESSGTLEVKAIKKRTVKDVKIESSGD